MPGPVIAGLGITQLGRVCGPAAADFAGQAVSVPQAKQCGFCSSTRLTWQPAAGGASVVSWTVTHTKPDPAGNTQTQVLVIATKSTLDGALALALRQAGLACTAGAGAFARKIAFELFVMEILDCDREIELVAASLWDGVTVVHAGSPFIGHEAGTPSSRVSSGLGGLSVSPVAGRGTPGY
jgi:hypothetical protein